MFRILMDQERQDGTFARCFCNFLTKFKATQWLPKVLPLTFSVAGLNLK